MTMENDKRVMHITPRLRRLAELREEIRTLGLSAYHSKHGPYRDRVLNNWLVKSQLHALIKAMSDAEYLSWVSDEDIHLKDTYEDLSNPPLNLIRKAWQAIKVQVRGKPRGNAQLSLHGF